MSLLKKSEKGKKIIQETYRSCQESLTKPKEEQKNHLKDLYAPFTDQEISIEIANLLKTDNISTDFESNL